MSISVVVPVYGCREAIQPLCQRLIATLSKLVDIYEIILVNDDCPQGSWLEIEKACSINPYIKGINLARNFGQIRAITAGLDYCSMEWVVVMDCDLQDRPEAIKELYEKALDGYDVVFAQRLDRKDKASVKIASRCFYKVYEYFTNGAFDYTICNFSISKKIVIDNYCKMREQNRAYTLFIKWLGFKHTAIKIEGDDRYAGASSYNLKRKFKMAYEFITAQSNKPLYFAINLGFICALISFLFLLYIIIHYFTSGDVTAGWSSLIASIYLVGGLIMITIGIVGIYIGNIFNEVKNRPLYVGKEFVNIERKE